MVQVQEDVKRLLTESKVLAMKSRMERLILAIGDGRNKDRETTPDPAPTGERKRTLGVLPSFITGTTDFILHLEAFRDYCVLNEFNVAEKVKRLFLMTLDQTAGGAESKLCFLCGMRMKNLSQAMSRMGGTQRGGMRGGRRWRGRGHRGDAVARWEVSLLTCLQLPPQTFDPSPQVRPSTSANSRIFRKVYE